MVTAKFDVNTVMKATAPAAGPSRFGIPETQSRLPLLNEGQRAAVDSIVDWLAKPGGGFFLLKAPAGYGKTFTMRGVAESIKGRMLFTAPTNKATRVLRLGMTSDDFHPDCATIYSALGLRLEPNGELRELTAQEEPVDLTKYAAVALDEGSMVGMKLMPELNRVITMQGIKVIVSADDAQLPPVKELRSPIFQMDIPTAELTKPMRHDNAILELATRIRKVVDHPAPTIKIETSVNADATEGVWRITPTTFESTILAQADLGRFNKPDCAKVVAWRNVTVDRYNALLRMVIFGAAVARNPWVVSDRVIFTAPAKDFADEPIASTDDEGTVERVTEVQHPIYSEFKCFAVQIMLDENRSVTAHVVHPESQRDWENWKTILASEARAKPAKWKEFWAFCESFHSLRHAYAITAHRAQGSTYEDVYVDYRDILLNRQRNEAYRCLYVACTRPRKRLYLA